MAQRPARQGLTAVTYRSGDARSGGIAPGSPAAVAPRRAARGRSRG